MKRFKVVLHDFVQDQITEQVVFIARDSIDNAIAWEVRLRTAIQALATAPGHAIDQDASERLGTSVRKYVFEGTYLIHYRVNESPARIDVINFRHGARLPRRGEP